MARVPALESNGTFPMHGRLASIHEPIFGPRDVPWLSRSEKTKSLVQSSRNLSLSALDGYEETFSSVRFGSGLPENQVGHVHQSRFVPKGLLLILQVVLPCWKNIVHKHFWPLSFRQFFWLDRDTVQERMPRSSEVPSPHTGAVLDATECPCHGPKTLPPRFQMRDAVINLWRRITSRRFSIEQYGMMWPGQHDWVQK